MYAQEHEIGERSRKFLSLSLSHWNYLDSIKKRRVVHSRFPLERDWTKNVIKSCDVQTNWTLLETKERERERERERDTNV